MSVGQVVYTPFPKYGHHNLQQFDLTKLSLNKGTVSEVGNKHYPPITYWENPNVDPKGLGLTVSMSPRFVFTEAEVRDILKIDPEIKVDFLLDDPATSRKAALQLLGVIVERMGDDLERKPLDPEY
ncbi:MAG: hypothetical protein M1365_08950 [Actinobacteria bacterium]|nr:hypothetical protein [Actinomycetota bacterium]